MMRVFLVDDHPLFRQALAATVHHIDEAIAVDQFETLADVRKVLQEGADAALILLDLQLPDSEGIAGLLALKAHHPDVPVAIVSAIQDRETVHTAAACGAAGFVPKSVSVSDLAIAIEALIKGETWFFDPGESEAMSDLTPHQTRILDCIHRGMMNKQIAYELGISEATVKYHVTGLFRKLGVQHRAQLTARTR